MLIKIALLTVVFAFALLGCGGGSSAQPEPSPEPSLEPSPEPSPVPDANLCLAQKQFVLGKLNSSGVTEFDDMSKLLEEILRLEDEDLFAIPACDDS